MVLNNDLIIPKTGYLGRPVHTNRSNGAVGTGHPTYEFQQLLRQKRPNNLSRFVDRKHTIQMPAIAFDHKHFC